MPCANCNKRNSKHGVIVRTRFANTIDVVHFCDWGCLCGYLIKEGIITKEDFT